MQMCSPAVLQNPKCTLLNVDATVHLLKVYDLTGKRPTVELSKKERSAKIPIKDQKIQYENYRQQQQ